MEFFNNPKIQYYWRTTKSQSGDWYDMYDMMSGGNGYTVSDMALASKV